MLQCYQEKPLLKSGHCSVNDKASHVWEVGGEEGFATNVSRKELDMVKYIMDTCKCE
jgi:hypothetical protein